jgi:hypothetical protein
MHVAISKKNTLFRAELEFVAIEGTQIRPPCTGHCNFVFLQRDAEEEIKKSRIFVRRLLIK